MYRADSHLHSLHSFDSAAPMEAQCEAACAAGMEEICFTEHFSVNPLVPTYGYLDRARYDADYAACRGAFAGRLRVYKGIELCEPHRYAERYRELFARGAGRRGRRLGAPTSITASCAPLCGTRGPTGRARDIFPSCATWPGGRRSTWPRISTSSSGISARPSPNGRWSTTSG